MARTCRTPKLCQGTKTVNLNTLSKKRNRFKDRLNWPTTSTYPPLWRIFLTWTKPFRIKNLFLHSLWELKQAVHWIGSI